MNVDDNQIIMKKNQIKKKLRLYHNPNRHQIHIKQSPPSMANLFDQIIKLNSKPLKYHYSHWRYNFATLQKRQPPIKLKNIIIFKRISKCT